MRIQLELSLGYDKFMLQLDAKALGIRRVVDQRLFDQCQQINLLQVNLQLTCFKLFDIEYVINQTHQTLTILIGHLY